MLAHAKAGHASSEFRFHAFFMIVAQRVKDGIRRERCIPAAQKGQKLFALLLFFLTPMLNFLSFAPCSLVLAICKTKLAASLH